MADDDLLKMMGGGTDTKGSGPGGKVTSWDEFRRQGNANIPQPLWARLPPGKEAQARFRIWEKQPWFQSLVDYTKLPAEGVMNTLGALQRGNVEQIADLSDRKPGASLPYLAEGLGGPLGLAVGSAVSPAMRQQMGRDIHAMVTPNDPTPEMRAEHAVHLEKLMSKDPGLRGMMQNFAVKTAFQTLTDPLTFTGVGSAALAEKVLGAYDVVSRMALLSKNTAIRSAANALTTNVPEKLAQAKEAVKTVGEVGRYASPGEKLKAAVAQAKAIAKTGPQDRQTISAINSARNKAMDVGRRLQSSDAELLQKYKPWFKNATIGDWLTKNAEYMQKRGTGNLSGIWPKEIEQRLAMGRPGQEMTLFKLPEPPPGVDRHVWESKDAESILRNMLGDSREMIRQNTIEDALHANTKTLTPEQIQRIAKVEPESTGGSILHKVSRAQQDAMLTTGVPHMRNVGVAGYMALGEAGVAKAAYYALHGAIPDSVKQRLAKFGIKGMPEQVGKRLEEGGTMHFGLSEPGDVVGAADELVPGFRKFRQASTGALDKWDEALRAVRLEQLDRLHGNAMTDFEKMDRVNQDLGAYNLRPRWTSEWAPAVGANFPQWHGYIVPTMLMRGMLRNPGRVGRFGRYETNFNDTFFPNEPYRWTAGGPIDEGFSAAADPVRVLTGQYPSYFGGPSTLGAGSLLLRPSYVPLGQRAIEYGAGVVPFGTAATEGYFQQFPQVPGAVSSGAGLAGFYTQKRTPGSMRRTAGQQQQPQGTTASTDKGGNDLLKIMAGGTP